MKDKTIKKIDNLLNKTHMINKTLYKTLNELIPDNTYIFLVCETGACTIPAIVGQPGNMRLVHTPSFRKHNGHFYAATLFDKCDKEVKPEDVLPYDPYNYNAFIASLQDYNEGHFVMLDDRDK